MKDGNRTVHGSILSVKSMCTSHVFVYYGRRDREKRTKVRFEKSVVQKSQWGQLR